MVPLRGCGSSAAVIYMKEARFDCGILLNDDGVPVDPDSMADEGILVPDGMDRCPLSPICDGFGECFDCRYPEAVLWRLSLFFEYRKGDGPDRAFVFSAFTRPDILVAFYWDRVNVLLSEGGPVEVDSVDGLLSVLGLDRRSASSLGDVLVVVLGLPACHDAAYLVEVADYLLGIP